MEVRELKAKDLKTAAHIIGKLDERAKLSLLRALGDTDSPKTQQQKMELGFTIIQIAAANMTDDIYALLADLVGMSAQEFDDMPINTPKEIITTLIDRGDLASFFGMSSTSTESPDGGQTQVTESSIDTDGQTEKLNSSATQDSVSLDGS